MNACVPRSQAAIAEAVDLLDPEHNVLYLPEDLDGDGKDETKCNWFLFDLLVLLDARVPRVRANKQIEYLREEKDGWRKATPAEAMVAAVHGQPAVVGWHNNDGPVGHVALVRAPPPGEHGVWIAQAGRVPLAHRPLIEGFGHKAPLEFFVHP